MGSRADFAPLCCVRESRCYSFLKDYSARLVAFAALFHRLRFSVEVEATVGLPLTHRVRPFDLEGEVGCHKSQE